MRRQTLPLRDDAALIQAALLRRARRARQTLRRLAALAEIVLATAIVSATVYVAIQLAPLLAPFFAH
jgi:hypothetical protein